MTNELKLKMFDTELDFISNKTNEDFVKNMILKLPDYFFEIPASTTGKYHPTYALGDGGLVRHTRAAVRIAIELFTIFPNFTSEERDIIISALILHDGCKCGRDGGQYTITTHPLEVAKLIAENYNTDFSKEVQEGIKPHMGQWNKDYKTGKEVLPLPQGKIQRYIHMCDYLASRKCLEFNFDAPLEKRW